MLLDDIDERTADGKLLYKVYGAQVEDAMTAVDAAHKAFPAWSVTPAIERRAIFQKAAALTRERMQGEY